MRLRALARRLIAIPSDVLTEWRFRPGHPERVLFLDMAKGFFGGEPGPASMWENDYHLTRAAYADLGRWVASEWPPDIAGRILWLGDSWGLYTGTACANLLDNISVENVSVGGRRLIDMIADAERGTQPDAVVLQFGVNDVLRRRRTQEVVADVRRVSQAVGRKVPLVVLGVPPLAGSIGRCAAMNEALRRLADQTLV